MRQNTVSFPVKESTSQREERAGSYRFTTAANPYRLKTGPFSSHHRIVQYLLSCPRTNRILDVGTAYGYLGEVLRDEGFTHVDGLEQDPVHVQAARKVYNTVIEHNLDLPEQWSLSEPYDIIICADVLEHLRDPWRTLNWLVQALAPGGRLLISVPNSGHWWFRLNVLVGRFPVEDRGLFDQGHLRFFTWTTLKQLTSEVGLEIERKWVTPIPFTLLPGGSSRRTIALAEEALYYFFVCLWKRLLTYQFVLVTHRQSDSN